MNMPDASNVSAHAMQDDWLTGPGDLGRYDYEVMIQYDHENGGACPSTASIANGTWNYGVTATNVMFNGSPWYLCDGQTTAGRTSSGGCPSSGCGPVVWMPGTPGNTANESSVSLNLKAMFQWLENNDPPGETYPYMAQGQFGLCPQQRVRDLLDRRGARDVQLQQLHGHRHRSAIDIRGA